MDDPIRRDILALGAAVAAVAVAPRVFAQQTGARGADTSLDGNVRARLMESAMDWGTISSAARDAAYNNGAAVSDSTQIIEGWIAASKRFRAERAQHLDLAYAAGERNKWDLFPGRDPNAPCLVWIHGGYWQARNRESFACFAEGVLERGWSAALPGYTLAPGATMTEIVREIRSALDWLAAQGSRHGIAGPIVLSGWSAGGHLTAMTLDHPSVRAGLAISGLFELGPIRDTYLNERLKLTDEEIATLSPLRLQGVAKPLAIAYGTAELPPLVADSRNYHAHRAAAHLPGPLIPVSNANHYTIMEELRSPDGLLARTAMRLLEDVGN
jgi:acetyl esterase/lipase